MENLNYTYDNAIMEDDFNEFGYGEPEMQTESIIEEDYYSDSYNFYPDAGF